MVSYDSDSSGEEQDFTETNVLLGYTSKEAGSETEWLVPDKPPTSALARCKVCKDLMVLLLQLNGELPERFPGHERRIYVFACRRKPCRRQAGSIRAIRGLRVSGALAAAAVEKQTTEKQKAAAAAKEVSKPVTSTGVGESLFGVKAPAGGGSGSANPFAAPGANPFSSAPPAAAANPFSTKPAAPPKPAAEEHKEETGQEKDEAKPEAAAAELPQTFAQKLALNNPQVSGPPPLPEPWPAESEPGQPQPYPVSWIAEAEYETLDPTPMPSVPTGPTAMELDEEATGGGSSGRGGKEDKEVFESSMDTDFQKFADRVGQNPDQVIRYEYAGVPLLYSRDDEVGRALAGAEEHKGVKTSGGMPPCGNCAAARVFEVQLTPQAIADLEDGGEDGLDGMDWGTVIVGVCSRDCQERTAGDGEAGYLEEWTGVQWEELIVKR